MPDQPIYEPFGNPARDIEAGDPPSIFVSRRDADVDALAAGFDRLVLYRRLGGVSRAIR